MRARSKDNFVMATLLVGAVGGFASAAASAPNNDRVRAMVRVCVRAALDEAGHPQLTDDAATNGRTKRLAAMCRDEARRRPRGV